MKPTYWTAFCGLIIANVTTIISFVLGWVTFTELLWSYWCQSVLIGVFSAVRMSRLKNFSTEGFTSNGRRVTEDAAGRRSTVLFFIAHYGIFHGVYLIFLIGLTEGSLNLFTGSTLLIVLFVFFFLGSEFLVLREQMRIDALGKPNIGSMMFLPYLRVIPMHLTIIFGGFAGFGSLIFLILKLFADLMGHYVDERINLSATKNSADPDRT